VRLAPALIALAFAGPASLAGAQDFAAPAPPAATSSAAAFLEDGLPPARGAASFEALATSWYGLPDLATRAVALGGGWRAARAAAGFSQTGDPELGWSAAGLGLGLAGPEAGGGLRAVVRRDRLPRSGGALDGAGLEVGGAAWVRAGAGLTVQASAPQLWERGREAPLGRGCEIGATGAMDDLAFRLARVSPRGGAGAARHEAALGLAAGGLRVWLAARDQPLRGALGLAARAGPIAVAAAVESHPVLGETVRISLALGGARP
jgi:hypothetical protein